MIKLITVFDVNLEPNKWIHGDGNSVVFNKSYNGDEKDTEIEKKSKELKGNKHGKIRQHLRISKSVI